VAVDAAGLAANQFRNIRIFLLRHDRRSCAEAICDIYKAESRIHPQNQFLGKSRQVHHDQRGAGGEFDGEIPVRNSIQGVFANAVKAKQFGNVFALDRVACSGQRRRTEWQTVHALAAIDQSVCVAFEHLEISHQVMGKGDRLSDLQMSESRHDGIRMPGGQVEQSALQRFEKHYKVIDRAA
jgi:hypothetical protein